MRKRLDRRQWLQAYKKRGPILTLLELFTISTREDTATQEFRYRVRIIAQEDLQRDPGDTCARVTGVEVFRLFLFRMFHLEFKSCKLQFQLFFTWKYYQLLLGH